jgi:triosephosphate isomerase
MRKKIVAGNWKLNNTIEESIQLAKEVSSLVDAEGHDGVDVVVCPTSVNLYAVAQNLSANVHAGAQNCYDKSSGAYTGEVSAAMAKSVGASHVILGHSERREYFAEDNAFLAAKTNAVLAQGLTPLFCCGETLEQRESGIHFDFVKSQLTESLFHLDVAAFKKVVIAYEPIWAIGTGVTASSDQAQEMHKELRDHLASKYGQEVADEISILYGGSCKPANAKEIFSKADVDGGLIGGAALVARDFIDIVKSF